MKDALCRFVLGAHYLLGTCWYYLLTFPPDRAGPVPPEGSVNGPTEGCVRFPLTSPLTVR